MSTRYQTMKGSLTEYHRDGKTYSWSTDSDTVSEIKADSQRRRPGGWIPPTPYTLDYTFNRGHTGTYVFPPGFSAIERTGQLGRLTNHSAMNLLPLPGNARNDAIIKARLKLKDQTVNLGVALAEAQATADLIGSTATRLARAYQSLKQRDAKGFFKNLGLAPNKKVGRHIDRGGNAPDKWLELQYGWLPLFGDVHGSVEALKRQQRGNMMQTVSSRVSATEKGVASKVMQTYCGEADYHFHKETGYFLRLDFRPGNDFLNALSRAGTTNPFEVVWERVPFSFVADWFLPVGDFLGSLDATIGWEFAGGSESYFKRVAIVSQQTVGSQSSYQGSFKRVSLVRNVLDSAPNAMRPGFKNPISVGHLANGLSLIASVFGGLKRPWFNNRS